MEILTKSFKTKVSKTLSGISTKAKDAIWIIIAASAIASGIGYNMATNIAVRVAGS